MIEDFLGGCLESFGHWIFGPIFFVVGVWVLFTAPGADRPMVAGYLGFLLLHTSAMLLIGFGFERLKKFLVISWLVSLVGFLGGVAALAALA